MMMTKRTKLWLGTALVSILFFCTIGGSVVAGAYLDDMGMVMVLASVSVMLMLVSMIWVHNRYGEEE